MRKTVVILIALSLILLLPACSIKKMAFNSVADMLAPAPSDKPAEGPNPMVALTGESDPELVGDFFPTALKLYEILHLQNPEHEDLAIITGQLYVTYANAFVQGPAERFPPEEFDKQDAAYRRAQVFYMRGRDFAVKALDHRYPGFSADVFGLDDTARAGRLSKCGKKDAAALYWAGAGLLGAFSLNPLETVYLEKLSGSVAMLEKAAEVDPSFSDGAIWEVLTAFYAAAPDSLGGGKDKAHAAYDKAIDVNGGKNPSTYVTYVRSFCIPTQDGEGFDEYLDKALAIDPESNPDNRLAIILAQRQALWLKEHKADIILE